MGRRETEVKQREDDLFEKQKQFKQEKKQFENDKKLGQVNPTFTTDEDSAKKVCCTRLVSSSTSSHLFKEKTRQGISRTSRAQRPTGQGADGKESRTGTVESEIDTTPT